MTTPFPFQAGAVLQAAQLNAITTLPMNDQTASYVAVLGDVGKRIVMNVASANTVTLNNSIFAVGDTIEVLNKGAGETTITAGAGVTLNGLSLVLSQYQGASITFLSASVALVFPTGGSVKTPRITAFAASGTFTPAAGVTHAVAYILGAGGGLGASSGAGGNSSVAFASGTITATGGAAINLANSVAAYTTVGTVNSGQGAFGRGDNGSGASTVKGGDGAFIVASGAVTPAVGITVTVGAGGTAGTNGAAGGSGYVYIETFE